MRAITGPLEGGPGVKMVRSSIETFKASLTSTLKRKRNCNNSSELRSKIYWGVQHSLKQPCETTWSLIGKIMLCTNRFCTENI